MLKVCSMPVTATIFRVFIASPSDVKRERMMCRSVIEEINRTWHSTHNLYLVPVMWEYDAFPGVGVDSQAVLNSEIGNDYDIFVGIMWARFGTPTGRADSGTEEEYERAYEKYK